MTEPRESVEADLDALRRRLYRADATESDLRRYVDEVGAPPVPATEEEPAPVRRRRAGIAIAGVLVAALVLAGTVRGLQHTAPPIAAAPSPAAQLSLGDAERLAVDEAASVATPVAASIDGSDVVGERYQGYGTAVIAYDPPLGSSDGGRMSIAVTSIDPARVSWRALLIVTRQDWTSYPLVLASGVAEDRRGAHAPTVFVYPNRPTTRIVVRAPRGVGWTLVVAVTSRIAPELQ